MQMKHVLGILLLISPFVSAGARADNDTPKADDRRPAQIEQQMTSQQEMDELEKTVQSAYDYNDQMQELGEPGD